MVPPLRVRNLHPRRASRVDPQVRGQSPFLGGAKIDPDQDICGDEWEHSHSDCVRGHYCIPIRAWDADGDSCRDERM